MIIFCIAVSLWGVVDTGIDISSMDGDTKLKLLHYLLLLASSLMLGLYITVGYDKKGPIHLSGCAGMFILSIIVCPVLGCDISVTMLVLIVLSTVSVAAFIVMMFLGDIEKANIASLAMVIVVTISSLCVIFMEDTSDGVLNTLKPIVSIVISISLALFYRYNSNTISG